MNNVANNRGIDNMLGQASADGQGADSVDDFVGIVNALDRVALDCT